MHTKCLRQSLVQSKDSVTLAKNPGGSRISSFIPYIRFLSQSSGSTYKIHLTSWSELRFLQSPLTGLSFFPCPLQTILKEVSIFCYKIRTSQSTAQDSPGVFYVQRVKHHHHHHRPVFAGFQLLRSCDQDCLLDQTLAKLVWALPPRGLKLACKDLNRH